MPGEPRVNGREPRLAANPVDPAADPDAPLPDPDDAAWIRHKPPFYYQPRVLLAFLIVILFVGAVALASRHPTWPPKAQCGTPAMASSTDHVKKGYPVYWAATGAAGTYAVTFGAKSARMSGGKLVVTGSESMAEGAAFVVRQPATLTGCRWIAHVTNPFPTGEYHLRLFRISGDTATQVAATRVDSDG
ncbi:hypothetical protein GCM10022220_48860 [Actinocatenispora rupis]|uniref:Uncharacterized protein n=1 Tax=Actinocatenispora rupis TaxID=519421 RepID=A0A8J3JCM0_9ACTN|nr:hypothetical protein Aru02nite_49260 [Actinocatenispora rupis]